MDKVIERLDRGEELGEADIREAADRLLDASVEAQWKENFLEALARKGESAGEIAAFVGAFLERAVDPGLSSVSLPGPTLDLVGTGGDKLGMFNVSTTAIFVLAAGGVSVVKHGNRAITSRSGGADVLEALGVAIDLPPERFAGCVQECGVGFLFAPLYHPSFKAVAPIRQSLAKKGVRTVFNLLGPLLNPARPDFQVIGVYDPAMLETFAVQMKRLGRKRGWAVHGGIPGASGMDELSTLGPSAVVECRADAEELRDWEINPAELGLSGGKIEDLVGGDASENAQITLGILEGEIVDARRSMVVLNAAAGFVVAGLATDMEEGIERAGKAIDSGAARERLKALVGYR